MKIVIYGSRTLPTNQGNYIFHHVGNAIMSICRHLGHDGQVEMVCGMARGADMVGLRYARMNGLKVYEYPAQWELYGKQAGFVRNRQMALVADGGVELWDGQSRGTYHMRGQLQDMEKPVFGYQFGFRLWENDDTDDGWLSM